MVSEPWSRVADTFRGQESPRHTNARATQTSVQFVHLFLGNSSLVVTL